MPGKIYRFLADDHERLDRPLKMCCIDDASAGSGLIADGAPVKPKDAVIAKAS